MVVRGLVSAVALLFAAACATAPEPEVLDWKCTELACFSMRVAGPERTVVVENRGQTEITVRPRPDWARGFARCCDILDPPTEVVLAPHERRDLMRIQLRSLAKHVTRHAVAVLQSAPPFDVVVGRELAAPVPAEPPPDP